MEGKQALRRHSLADCASGAQRETKRQRLRRALAHQRLGLPPPPGVTDLEVERDAVPELGTAAHQAAFDAALGLGSPNPGPAEPRVDPEASEGDADVAESDAEADESDASGVGADQSPGVQGRGQDSGAGAPVTPAEPAVSAAERLRQQREALAAARAELGLAAPDLILDPASVGDATREAGGCGGGGSGGRGCRSAAELDQAGASAPPAAQPTRVVHLQVLRSTCSVCGASATYAKEPVLRRACTQLTPYLNRQSSIRPSARDCSASRWITGQCRAPLGRSTSSASERLGGCPGSLR